MPKRPKLPVTPDLRRPNPIKSIDPGLQAIASRPVGLTEKENHWIEVYLRTGSPTEASKAIGSISPKDGHRYLDRPHIAAEIARRRQLYLDKLDVTPERVINEIAHIAFSQMPDIIRINALGEAYFDLENLSPTMKRSIKSITMDTVMVKGPRGKQPTEVRKTKVELYDKLGALTTLAKYFGLLRDKVEVSGPGGGPIPVAQEKTREILANLSTEALEELETAVQIASARENAEDL